MKFRKYLEEHYVICDGAMGTYYESLYRTDEKPEFANEKNPERILSIHREYVKAGANLIRTNTFASNTKSLKISLEAVKENIKEAYRLANVAASEKENTWVACDFGPISNDDVGFEEKTTKEYVELAKAFYEAGGRIFLFETFSHVNDLSDVFVYLNECRKQHDIFTIVQFSVNQFGYSTAGFSLRHLIEQAKNLGADCVGVNCGIGPGHMEALLRELTIPTDCCFSVLPNAGYPQRIQNRVVFSTNTDDYFVETCTRMLHRKIDLIGGCCGTTPETIKRLAETISCKKKERTSVENPKQIVINHPKNHSFYQNAFLEGRKVIAVELAPPFDIDDSKLLDAAHRLEKMNVDVLTFPDSPSGRTRIDPILMAQKVKQETELNVMPHLCCRDKNTIAIRSQLLGAKINGIHNFLVITGDPVNTQSRDTVKSVFQFDSVGFMNLIRNINEEVTTEDPLYYGGAINQGRKNLSVEINRVKKKMHAGATFFLSQPVFSEEGIERLRKIKEETGANILCGIMPLVSKRNATFMKNEIAGIDVPQSLVDRYPTDATKEEGEAVGVALAKEMIAKTQDFADGYYFSFPFNRVYLLEQILGYHTFCK